MNTLIKYFGLTVNIVEQTIDFNNDNQKYFCGQHEFYLEIDDVAKYYVEARTNTIYFEKSPALTEPHMVDTWMYGTVFAYILQYNGYLVLHGSAVMYNDTAIVFSGNSGAGKSTLAAKLNSRGYPLLTDDIVAISHNKEHKLVMSPGHNKVKLWSNALEHFGLPNHNLKPILNKVNKFELPITLHQETPVKISAFYELNHHDIINHIFLEKVLGIEKINLLIHNTYRYGMLLKLENGLKTHLKQIGELANSISTYRITRPSHKYLLDELADMIEAQINFK